MCCLFRNLKETQGLIAVKENEYNKAQKAAELGAERLKQMQAQHDAYAREAKEAALVAQKHADGE